MKTELFTAGGQGACGEGQEEVVCSKLVCACRARAGGQPWVTGVVSPARLWVRLKDQGSHNRVGEQLRL